MARAVKIAISLPADVLAAAEAARIAFIEAAFRLAPELEPWE